MDNSRPKAELNSNSHLDIRKINLCANKNIKAIFSEKERIFTDFKILKDQANQNNQILILCDRSGRIYFMDPSSLMIIKQPFKGYRDVQVGILGQLLIAYLPKRNLI